MKSVLLISIHLNLCADIGSAPEVHREVNMVNYELMFVIDPTLEEAQRDAVIERYKAVIADSGEVEDVDVWGMRDLAYPIQKLTKGFYVVMQFKAEPDLPKELDRRLKIADDVIRHIIVNKDEA